MSEARNEPEVSQTDEQRQVARLSGLTGYAPQVVIEFLELCALCHHPEQDIEKGLLLTAEQDRKHQRQNAMLSVNGQEFKGRVLPKPKFLPPVYLTELMKLIEGQGRADGYIYKGCDARNATRVSNNDGKGSGVRSRFRNRPSTEPFAAPEERTAHCGKTKKTFLK